MDSNGCLLERWNVCSICFKIVENEIWWVFHVKGRWRCVVFFFFFRREVFCEFLTWRKKISSVIFEQGSKELWVGEKNKVNVFVEVSARDLELHEFRCRYITCLVKLTVRKVCAPLCHINQYLPHNGTSKKASFLVLSHVL